MFANESITHAWSARSFSRGAVTLCVNQRLHAPRDTVGFLSRKRAIKRTKIADTKLDGSFRERARDLARHFNSSFSRSSRMHEQFSKYWEYWRYPKFLILIRAKDERFDWKVRREWKIFGGGWCRIVYLVKLRCVAKVLKLVLSLKMFFFFSFSFLILFHNCQGITTFPRHR